MATSICPPTAACTEVFVPLHGFRTPSKGSTACPAHMGQPRRPRELIKHPQHQSSRGRSSAPSSRQGWQWGQVQCQRVPPQRRAGAQPGAHSHLCTRAAMPGMAVKSQGCANPRSSAGLCCSSSLRKGTVTRAGWSMEHNKHLPKLNITLPREIQTLLL